MTDKERLVELLENAGVIVPKFKVGQEVWYKNHEKKIVKGRVIETYSLYYDVATAIQSEKELFTTKSEAEEALGGGAK